MILKVCGITRRGDGLHAVEQGATALGFICWPKSPRYVPADRLAEIVAAMPAHVLTVGVFVNEPADRIRQTMAATGLTTVQLHGDESPGVAQELSWPVFKAMGVNEGATTAWPLDTVLLLDAVDSDARGGTGQVVDWRAAATVAGRRRVILAGGLTPANVGTAIETVRPFGVDVSSGVEAAPGIKDPTRVTEFLVNARNAFSLQAR